MAAETVALLERIEHRIAAIASAEAAEECWVPPRSTVATLAGDGYFDSFPRWLAAASHLGAVPVRATPPVDGGHAARCSDAGGVGGAPSASVCYHVFAAIADRTLDAPVVLTSQLACWTHGYAADGARSAGHPFSLREVVCVGAAGEAAAFCERIKRRTLRLVQALGLAAAIREPEEPFVSPTARGAALLQRVRPHKEELVLGPDAAAAVPAASFSTNERFFGEMFGIRLADGTPAATACAAFGVERWLLAFLQTHGDDPRRWPRPAQPPGTSLPA